MHLQHLKWLYISIHAPARGASVCSCQEGNIKHFNSRPCERGFFDIFSPFPDATYFNSRPCERGFEAMENLQGSNLNFNSRPCERGFEYGKCEDKVSLLFQFTPLREGLQFFLGNKEDYYAISIHAPARGASYGQER